jgi:hypothetical protein
VDLPLFAAPPGRPAENSPGIGRGKSVARGPFSTSPPGANFDPQGRRCPPGVIFVPSGLSYTLRVKFSVRPSILQNSRECSPLGVNEGVNIPPKGQISPLRAKFPLGVKFTPGGQGWS